MQAASDGVARRRARELTWPTLSGAARRTLARSIGCCLALALFLAGCAHHEVQARGPVLLPARVPVRAFPSIWVASGAADIERYLADRFASHLAQDGRHEVRRVQLAELEPARKEGRIPTGTVVALVELDLREGVRRYWDSAPVQYCGYYGCATDYQPYMATAPELAAEVVLTVYEGPTARVLQRERFHESIVGDEFEGMRSELVKALASDLEKSVDVLKLREPVELYRVKKPREVDQAVELIHRGNWPEGRALLERAAQSLGGLDKKTQAKVWFNLGLARWFAPGDAGLDQRAYEAAKRAFEWATRLDPKKPIYRNALARLERARADYAMVEEQRRATTYNYQILGGPRPPAPAASKAQPAEPPSAPASTETPAGAEAPAESGPSSVSPADATPSPPPATSGGANPPATSGGSKPAPTTSGGAQEGRPAAGKPPR